MVSEVFNFVVDETLDQIVCTFDFTNETDARFFDKQISDAHAEFNDEFEISVDVLPAEDWHIVNLSIELNDNTHAVKVVRFLKTIGEL